MSLNPAVGLPGGNIFGGPSNLSGDIVQTDLQTAQGFRLDFHQDFGVTESRKIDLVDASIKQPVPDLRRVVLQRGLGIRSRYQDPGQSVVANDSLHLRRFGVFRKGCDSAESHLDVRQRPLHVRARFELYEHGGATFVCRGLHAPYVIDESYLSIDGSDDIGFDVGGTGRRPRNNDRDRVNAEVRKKLGRHPVQTECTRDKHQNHEQIGRGAMSHEEADQASLLASSRLNE